MCWCAVKHYSVTHCPPQTLPPGLCTLIPTAMCIVDWEFMKKVMPWTRWGLVCMSMRRNEYCRQLEWGGRSRESDRPRHVRCQWTSQCLPAACRCSSAAGPQSKNCTLWPPHYELFLDFWAFWQNSCAEVQKTTENLVRIHVFWSSSHAVLILWSK